jgi:hypothetical protein
MKVAGSAQPLRVVEAKLADDALAEAEVAQLK